MELVYLWVEEYKNIKKQGFNFSPRFNCKYDDDTEELTIDENKDYVSIFPKNINITAIVGENGSGKTNILNAIMDMSISIRKILVYSHKEKLLLKLVGFGTVIRSYIERGRYIIKDIKPDDEAYFFYQENYKKVFFVNEEKNANIKWGNLISIYQNKSKDTRLIVNLLKNNDMKFPFEVPKFLHISMNDKTEHFSKVIQHYIDKHNFKVQFIKNNFFNLNYDKKENRIKLIKFYLIVSYIFSNVSDLSTRFYTIFNDKMPTSINDILEMFSIGIKDDILALIDSIVNEINNNFKTDKYYIDYEIDINGLSNDFIENYHKITYFSDITTEKDNCFLDFKFSPYLSQGEYNYIELFSKIFYSIDKENILLLIDEGENNLHPNWQKQYIYYIYEFLNINYSQYNIQLIITSHSPFILSDLPKENVIFLKNGKQVDVDIDTFGANIHTLLSHGFFMENGLMGEFAKEKINKAVEYLNKISPSKEEIDYCENIISIIGEPILKRQLQKMLDSKRLKKVDKIDDIEKQIVELSQELEKLKNGQN